MLHLIYMFQININNCLIGYVFKIYLFFINFNIIYLNKHFTKMCSKQVNIKYKYFRAFIMNNSLIIFYTFLQKLMYDTLYLLLYIRKQILTLHYNINVQLLRFSRTPVTAWEKSLVQYIEIFFFVNYSLLNIGYRHHRKLLPTILLIIFVLSFIAKEGLEYYNMLCSTDKTDCR